MSDAERESKVTAQQTFCNEHDLPMFAPIRLCWNCYREIWDRITLERSSSELITGCPICHSSFCE